MVTEWLNMKKIKSSLLALVTVFALATPAAFAAPSGATASLSVYDAKFDEKIRKELVTLPYFGVFDNLAFRRDGSTVTLYGQVIRPTTRSAAESRVVRLKGVERVINRIEVLPLSRFDDDIRVRAYRAVFGTSSLYRYAMSANPSVHIIVNRGRITLEGVVANRMDAQLAYIAARGVHGAFAVTNNLRVENADRDRRMS